MDFDDFFTTANIRQRHHHLAVETTGAQQRRVQNVRTVSGRNDDDALAAFKTIHLNQHLVQGLFAFVVTTAQTGATVTTDRIDFIDKDNAGRLFLGLFEHVAHAGSAHADKHFDEV